MDYTLMHKNVPVMELKMDPDMGTISEITTVCSFAHSPIGVRTEDGHINSKKMKNWWVGRSIPASRQGLQEALEKMQLDTPLELLNKSFGLSLSDQYWIKPKDSLLKWSDINFFENSFSEDVGNILFGVASSGKISFLTPDNTSDGWLRKRWSIMNGKRVLIKGGSGTEQQEPYNEVFASLLMDRLGINHVSYQTLQMQGKVYSACDDFITASTELVSAAQIISIQKQPGSVSNHSHFISCCKTLGISGVQQFLDEMIIVDYLIANQDRHFNNFGAIRCADTLEWKGMAPIYDSGTSLWNGVATRLISPRDPKLPSKPFRSTHEKQIELVSDFTWIEFDALRDIEEEFNELLKASPTIDPARREVLCEGVKCRCNQLEMIVRNKEKQFLKRVNMELDICGETDNQNKNISNCKLIPRKQNEFER